MKLANFLLLFFVGTVLATLPGHIGFGDSSAYFRIRGTLGDSLSVSRFDNTPKTDKHTENSLFVELFINGAITDKFTFQKRYPLAFC